MKIVLVGTAYPLRGGIAHYIALLYRHLSTRHSVEIVTFSRQYPEFLFPGTSQKEQGGAAEVVPSVPLIDSMNPLTWLRAGRAIAKRKPDVVVFKYWLPFFGPCFGVIARIVRRRTGARIVFICGNVVPHEPRWGDRAFTRFAFRAVDFFIVQSAAVERDLRSFWPSARYSLVPHPIYEIFGRPLPKAKARRQLGLAPREKVALFFGYIRSYKGLTTLLKAMPLIRAQVPLRLLVVGEFYEDDQPYRRLIEELGLVAFIELRGEYLPNDQVAPYFCASDVVVLPYRSATQSGIVQIAYQFDKPVIATNVGGLTEVVKDGVSGLIVPPDNPDALAEAVVRFFKKRMEKGLVRGVRREKKKYSWDALVKAIERAGADVESGPKSSRRGTS